MTTDTIEASPALQTLASNLGVDLQTEIEAFKAYNRGSDVRHPERALEGWIRKAATRKAKPAQAETKPPPENDPEVLKQRFVDAFKASNPAEYDRLEKYLAGHAWWSRINDRLRLEEMRQAIRDRHGIFNHIAESRFKNR